MPLETVDVVGDGYPGEDDEVGGFGWWCCKLLSSVGGRGGEVVCLQVSYLLVCC